MKEAGCGDDVSRDILVQADADPESLHTTNVRGGQPGGTAGIGRVVNIGMIQKLAVYS